MEVKLVQALEDVVALGLEMLLEGDLLLLDVVVVEEGDSRELEGMVRSSVEEGAGLGKGGDKVLGTEDPAAPPAGKTPVLSEPVDDDDGVLVDVLDVLSRRDIRS